MFTKYTLKCVNIIQIYTNPVSYGHIFPLMITLLDLADQQVSEASRLPSPSTGWLDRKFLPGRTCFCCFVHRSTKWKIQDYPLVNQHGETFVYRSVSTWKYGKISWKTTINTIHTHISQNEKKLTKIDQFWILSIMAKIARKGWTTISHIFIYNHIFIYTHKQENYNAEV